MSEDIKVELTVPRKFLDYFRIGLKKTIENPGDEAMYKIHKLLADEFRPYVPVDSSKFADDEVMVDKVEITPERFSYPGPYAHYVYEGLVYGPNFPILDAEGNVVAWRSPKGKKKHPTGKLMQYSTDGTSSHWDRIALQNRREEIESQIRDIILEAWKSGHR